MSCYSAYHQIVTSYIVKNRNDLKKFGVFLVDNFRKFPKKIAKHNDLVAGTVFVCNCLRNQYKIRNNTFVIFFGLLKDVFQN